MTVFSKFLARPGRRHAAGWAETIIVVDITLIHCHALAGI
jgi:hypothetical protein